MTRSVLSALACWRLLLGATLSLSATLAAFPINAQDAAVFERGDAVVTGFSGTSRPDPLPAGDPLDETFIDLDGASAQIFRLEPGAPPSAQVISAPPIFQVKARDVGQVFAIGLDGTPLPDAAGNVPNIYLGATSAFGLQIVIPDSDDDGRPERVKNGQANAAWMAGQFGVDKGGGPGSVWKVDGKTGAVSLFATIPGNSGPGLGDIVFDAATRQFFVSDLDTGLIHRLDSSGALQDTFDHGQSGRTAAGLGAVADDGASADIKSSVFDSQNPASWGFTQPERRVWGLGLRAGRLYYAVSEGPTIWSVSLNLDGTFGKDPRREIEVSGTPNNHPISDIAFDSADYMYVAQRGGIQGSYDYSIFADAKESLVFRFKREIPEDPATPGIWVPIPDEYAIGFPPDYRNTSGGLALGYGYDETGALKRGACDAMIWSTGDALRDNAEYATQLDAGGPAIVNGLQGNDRSLIRPDNEPPLKSYFVDYDGKSDDPQNQGHVGDVEIWQPCDHAAGFGGFDPWWSYPIAPPAGAPAAPPGDTPEDAPPSWPPVPPPTPDSFNLLIDKEATPEECVAGGLGWICTYAIRVTNMGPGLYFGLVEVTDWLPDAPAGAAMTFSAPWVCAMIAPTEHECTHPLVLLFPGDSIDLFVQVELPAAYGECFLANAVRIEWPAGFGDANPADDAAFDSAAIPSAICVSPPDGPPGDLPTNLQVQKSAGTCSPGVAGGFNCFYLIQVTNTGPGVYSGSIEIDDQLSATPAGWVHSPGWACAVVAGDFRHCTHPPVVLGPGESVFLEMGVHVPDGFGACRLDNQVRITHAPGGSAQNTDPADDVASASADVPSPDCVGPVTNLRIEKKAEAPCAPVPPEAGIDALDCKFEVLVTNTGPGIYSGPLEIRDELPPLPADTVLTLWMPAGGCSVFGPPPQTCVLPAVTLAPGESVHIRAIVLLISPYAACDLTNTARITVPTGAPHNTDGGDDVSTATALVDSPSCNVGRTNLRIRKIPIDASCWPMTIAGPDPHTRWNCRYYIRIINEGPGSFRGPIEVEDETPPLPAGSTVGMSDPGGVGCALGPPPQTCLLPDVILGPGGWIVLEATAYIRAPSDAVLLTCELTNTARIASPPGSTEQNFDGSDDESSATLSFDPLTAHGLIHCAPPPAPIMHSNLRIVKTAETPQCERRFAFGMTGWLCLYRIRVTNTGPDNYTGPIEFQDILPDPLSLPTGTVMRFSDYPYSVGVPALCFYGGPVVSTHTCRWDATLNRDETKEFRVEVMVPLDRGSPCVLTNTARITAPLGAPQNTDASDDESWVTTPFEPWVAAEGTTRGLVWQDIVCPGGGSEPIVSEPPEPAPCPQGWSKTPVPGKCCPANTSWDGKQCRRGVPPLEEKCPPNSDSAYKYPDCRCKQGFVGTPPNCTPRTIEPPRPPQCPPNSVGEYPNCRCPQGFTGTPPNCKQIVEECPKGFVGTPPNCKPVIKECPKGTTGKYPDCKPIECPKGTTGKYPDCKPIACPRGTTGQYPNCKPIECPKGTTGRYPDCKPIVKACPKGFVGTPPNCKPIVIRPPECPKGTTGKYPNCKPIVPDCKKGEKLNRKTGKCEPLPPPLIRTCPRGFVGTPPNCKPIVQKCPKGTTGTYPNCKPVGTQLF